MNAILLLLVAALLSEPAARRLVSAPVNVESPFGHVSAVRELRDGRLLVTDAIHPGVFVLSVASGKVTKLGSVGAAPGQYVRPGGLYAGLADSILLIDRDQTRLMAISAHGVLGPSRSIAQRGVTGGSSADVDQQRLDQHGLVYFASRGGFGRNDSAAVVRLDPVSQKKDTVVRLRKPEEKVTQAGDHMTLTQLVVGSPADAWDVAPDGRIAVVRAVPYQVEWRSPSGKIARGPAIAYDPLPMTDADRRAFATKTGRGGAVSAGMVGDAPVSSADVGDNFAATKPPFSVDDVRMATDGRVWVRRSAVFGATSAIYDVFDETGKRADRVELPAGERVVGFGPSCVYTAVQDSPTQATLRKYKL